MVNLELLEYKIQQSGLKLYAIASACNLTVQGFHNKLKGKSEFKHSEMVALCNILHLTDLEKNEIFFA